MNKLNCYFLYLFCLFSFGSSQAANEHFLTEPAIHSISMSPNGKRVARLVLKNEAQQLELFDIDSNKTRMLFDLAGFTPNESKLSKLTWIDNNNLASQFVEFKKGVGNLVDTRKVSYLFIISIPNNETEKVVVKSVKTSGWLIEPRSLEDDVFYYAKSGAHSKIYKVKVSQLHEHKKKHGKFVKKDGGQFKKANEVVSVEGYATYWFTDKNSEPKAVLLFNRKGELQLSRILEDGSTKVIISWDKKALEDNQNKTNKIIIPVALANENSFYGLDFSGEDKKRVYLVDYEKNTNEVIYQSDSYKIVDLLISSDQNLIGVQVLSKGKLVNQYINSELSQAKKNSEQYNIRSYLNRSSDNERVLVYEEDFNRPGRFYVVESGKENKIVGLLYPSIPDTIKGKQLEGKVEVEGLEIPYIVNLPAIKTKTSKVPLIVFPHGGPIGVFDDYGFNIDVQYLISNGFAVLRVNYRGSSGFTQKLEDAGKGEWGDRILSDIFAATNAVAKLQQIDESKICVFGMSYGGYAAVMLPLKHPEVYRCGVSYSGVTDVNLHITSPYASELQQKWLKENVGDPVKDYEKLKKISPVYTIANLKKPILIMHGSKDEVVDVEHFYRLKLMMEKKQIPFEWKLFEEAGHHLVEKDIYRSVFLQSIEFIRAKTQ